MAPEEVQAIVDRICQQLAPALAEAVKAALDPVPCESAGPTGTAPAGVSESRKAQAFMRGLHRPVRLTKRANLPKPTRKGSRRATR